MARRPVAGERGQAHTLEAIVGALLVLSAVLFALQMTAVTPLSASTSSQHIENQQRTTASGVLAASAETGALEEAVLFWNTSGSRFHGSDQPNIQDVYINRAPPNEFGTLLDQSFDRRGIAYNVNVVYKTNGSGTQTQQMVHQGVPSDNAVSASRLVTLMDDDTLYDSTGTPTATAVSRDTFYAPDAAPNTPVYNVVRVEVVVWRI